jgi:hypothetical protein
MIVFFVCFSIPTQIHRDIKAENCVVDAVHRDSISIIDLGLAKRYRNRVTRAHISPSEHHGLIGTLRYISVVCLSPPSIALAIARRPHIALSLSPCPFLAFTPPECP